MPAREQQSKEREHSNPRVKIDLSGQSHHDHLSDVCHLSIRGPWGWCELNSHSAMLCFDDVAGKAGAGQRSSTERPQKGMQTLGKKKKKQAKAEEEGGNKKKEEGEATKKKAKPATAPAMRPRYAEKLG